MHRVDHFGKPILIKSYIQSSCNTYMLTKTSIPMYFLVNIDIKNQSTLYKVNGVLLYNKSRVVVTLCILVQPYNCLIGYY